MSAVKSDAQIVAEGRYLVQCTYFDSSKANCAVELDVNAALQDCDRNCKTTDEAKAYIIALRKHAAASQTVALLSITVTDLLDSSTCLWQWTA